MWAGRGTCLHILRILQRPQAQRLEAALQLGHLGPVRGQHGLKRSVAGRVYVGCERRARPHTSGCVLGSSCEGATVLPLLSRGAGGPALGNFASSGEGLAMVSRCEMQLWSS